MLSDRPDIADELMATLPDAKDIVSPDVLKNIPNTKKAPTVNKLVQTSPISFQNKSVKTNRQMVQSRYQPYSVIRAINTKTNIATESRRLVRPPVTSQVALPPLTRHKNSNTQMSTVAMPNYRFSHSFSHSQPSSAHPKLKTPTRNNIFTFDSLFSSPKTLHRQSSAEVLNLLSLSKEQNISTLSSPLMDALASPFTFTITNQDTTPVSTIQKLVENICCMYNIHDTCICIYIYIFMLY